MTEKNNTSQSSRDTSTYTDVRLLRNVGIVAHIDAGKTTLTERILFATDVISRMGEVQDGTTMTDWMPQERERGISINAAAVNCRWKQWQINVVDTPGHIDFTAEVERSLSVMDGIVALFCARNGVQAQSETVWRMAARHKLPALAFVNKMDREGADATEVVRQLADRLRVTPIPIQYPIGGGETFKGTVDLLTGRYNGPFENVDITPFRDEIREAREHLFECLAEIDANVLHDYLYDRQPSLESLRKALRDAVVQRRLVPVLFGSSLHNQGVKNLLDALGQYMPSPTDRPGYGNGTGKPSLLVFRVAGAPNGTGRLAYARVLSGTVKADSILVNTRNGAPVTITGVMKIQAADVEPMEAADEAEIVALSGDWAGTRTGDIIGSRNNTPILDESAKMRFPQPVVSITIEPIDCTSSATLERALKIFTREDPTLKAKKIPATNAWILSGMGELHLEIIRERLKNEYDINTKAGQPTVNYRDTVRDAARQAFVFDKHLPSGDNINAAVEIEVRPLQRGTGLKLDFSPLTPTLTDAQRHAVRQGVLDIVNAESNGFPLTDMKVKTLTASVHTTNADEPALVSAARQALIKALECAGRQTLEPVMQLEVSTPDNTLGNVIADLNARHAKITQVDTMMFGFARIVAFTPLAELFGYASSLRSLSAGRGEVVAESASYEPRATH